MVKSACTKNQQTSDTSYLIPYLKVLEQKEANTHKMSRHEEKKMKLRAEINKIETEYKESTEQRVGSLRKINKIDKPLSKLEGRQRIS